MTEKFGTSATRAQVVAFVDRRPVWLLLALGLLCGGLVYYLSDLYLTAPLRAATDEQWRAARELRRKNDEAAAIRQNQARFEQEFAQLVADARAARQMLPEQLESSKVLDGVATLARASGLNVLRFSAARPPVAAGKLYEVSLSAGVRGTHAQLVHFLTALSTAPRIVVVRQLAEESDGRACTMALDLATFYAVTPRDLPQIPPRVAALADHLPSPRGAGESQRGGDR